MLEPTRRSRRSSIQREGLCRDWRRSSPRLSRSSPRLEISPAVIKVKEGGYDQKVNETVSVVATKTTEIGQKTWGIMKGVMAMASQKVEEYTKDGGISSWKGDDWQRNESTKNGYYQDFSQGGSKGWDSTEDHASKNYNSIGSWDDWDNDKVRKEEPSKKGNQRGSDSWAGWDDVKDDDNNGYYNHSPSDKGSSNHKSGSSWGGGGFA